MLRSTLHWSSGKFPTKWLLSTLDPGGEVENDALLHFEDAYSERENRLRYQ